MVCGIDIFHEKNNNSVGGFVSSFDNNFTKWFSKTCIHEPNQELMNGLVYCFTSALKKYLIVGLIFFLHARSLFLTIKRNRISMFTYIYLQENKVLPNRIFIFRDGVSRGMLRYVQDHEVLQFSEACKLLSKNYEPKISFIVVAKRINIKYFEISVSRVNFYFVLPKVNNFTN